MLPEQLRENMVLGQIEPAGVTSASVIEAFGAVPREIFTPNIAAARAYSDEECEVSPTRVLLAPAVQARLIQALDMKGSDVVLDLGGATGYSAAVFSHIASMVVMVEDNQDYKTAAEENFLKLGVTNVVAFVSDLTKGCPQYAPYDVIFINGACAHIPEDLLAQLSAYGRLGCVLRESAQEVGKAMVFAKTGDGAISRRVLFEVNVPYLDGFTPSPQFCF